MYLCCSCAWVIPWSWSGPSEQPLGVNGGWNPMWHLRVKSLNLSFRWSVGWRNDKTADWKHGNEGRCWAGVFLLGSCTAVTMGYKQEGWGSANKALARPSWHCKQWMRFSELNTLNCAWTCFQKKWPICLLLPQDDLHAKPDYDEVLSPGLALMHQILPAC